jgi:hypothetical protein
LFSINFVNCHNPGFSPNSTLHSLVPSYLCTTASNSFSLASVRWHTSELCSFFL